MNVPRAIADALAAAGIAALDVNLQIGRYDVEEVPEGGLWSIVQAPGQPAGGNLATWKMRVPVQISVLLPADQAADMYDLDQPVRQAVLDIPATNALIPSIKISSVGDYEADVAEARVGVWNVEVVTITDGRTQ